MKARTPSLGDNGAPREARSSLTKAVGRLCSFILLGLMLAAPGEVLNQILARHNLPAFRNTMTSYSILLFVGFLARGGILRLFASRARAMVVYYLAFGCLGLAVEWFLLGNGPVANPLQVITQPGMFTYWGTMMIGPTLIMEPGGLSGLRRHFIRFFVVFSAVYLLVAAIIPKDHGGVFFGFIIFAAGTAWLNWYYIKFFRLLKAGASTVQRPALG